MTADTQLAPTRELRAEKGSRIGEGLVRLFVLVCGVFVVVSTVLVIAFLAKTGIKGIREIGLAPLVSGLVWKPEAGAYGGLPLLLGTLITATGAALVGALPAVLGALWITEFSGKRVKRSEEHTSELQSRQYLVC